MNRTYPAQPFPVDVESIASTIENALASAGLQTKTGPMRGVTDTIRRALSSSGMAPGGTMDRAPDAGPSVIDVVAREVVTPRDAPIPQPLADGPALPGEFVTGRYRNHAGDRAYRLYVPAGPRFAPMPLVVMLHGCTQSPEDFATGTKMNRLADRHGFLVVYPEQSPNANGSKCWNWFQSKDQVRDSGEPSLLAGMTRDVAAEYPVDPRRIFVAGLSAGAAMAVILGETYPELYAAVGAHSGLPYGAAHDVPSAFAAMKGSSKEEPRVAIRREGTQFVPTIVFHGDRDQTVRPGNGNEIVRQAGDAFAAQTGGVRLAASSENGVASLGRAYSRTVWSDAAGLPRVESWIVHGAGHAWSGGDAGGSFADGAGPDASAEMLRFFLAQPCAGSA